MRSKSCKTVKFHPPPIFRSGNSFLIKGFPLSLQNVTQSCKKDWELLNARLDSFEAKPKHMPISGPFLPKIGVSKKTNVECCKGEGDNQESRDKNENVVSELIFSFRNPAISRGERNFPRKTEATTFP